MTSVNAQESFGKNMLVYIPYILLTGLGVFVYINSLSVPFIGDDIIRITEKFDILSQGFYESLEILPDRPLLPST